MKASTKSPARAGKAKGAAAQSVEPGGAAAVPAKESRAAAGKSVKGKVPSAKTRKTKPQLAKSQDPLSPFDQDANYRALVAAIRDYAVFMLDLHGRIATWGPGAERIKGYTAREIIGKHFSIFYPPEAVESGIPLRNLKEAATVGRHEDEGWRVRKDGSRFWADVVITPLRDESGTLRGFVKVTRDFTERMEAQRQLETQNKRLVALIENNPLGILYVDADGRAQVANVAFCEMFQYGNEEIIGSRIHERIATTDSEEEWAEVSPRVTRGESFYLHTRRRRKDGTEVPVDLFGVPIMGSSGQLEGAYAIYRDVSERLSSEQALLESQASLRRLSSQILQLRDDQRQRVARDLHDLTSPAFASLLAKLHGMRKRLPESGGAEGALLSDAIALAESLSREVRNVSYELHPLMLDELGLVAALRGYLAALSQRKGRLIQAELAPGPEQRLPRAVELVLFRVVEEALEGAMGAATSVPARVRLFVDDGRICLEVLDPGRDIAPDALRRWLAGGTSEMGVGLAALRERMNHLGGRLEMESTPAGAVVRADWPLSADLP